MNNLLLVGYKPVFMTSNAYLSSLKKKYAISSGGYFGTLDPFAKGVMILAFGQFTRLFPYLSKTSKTYRATLWLGAKSQSLDIENILSVKEVPEVRQEEILDIFKTLKGEVTYIPPKFSAKKINGRRAYELARKGIDFDLKAVKMEIFELKLLCYQHPFVTFEAKVSGGSYVRSIGEMIAQKLGLNGILSSLERIEECGVRLDQSQEKKINPLEILKMPVVRDERLQTFVENGKKIQLENYENGFYVLDFRDFFSIIEVKESNVKYCLNRILKC